MGSNSLSRPTLRRRSTAPVHRREAAASMKDFRVHTGLAWRTMTRFERTEALARGHRSFIMDLPRSAKSGPLRREAHRTAHLACLSIPYPAIYVLHLVFQSICSCRNSAGAKCSGQEHDTPDVMKVRTLPVKLQHRRPKMDLEFPLSCLGMLRRFISARNERPMTDRLLTPSHAATGCMYSGCSQRFDTMWGIN